MRWCRFSVNDKVAYGIVQGHRVIQIRGSPFETYVATRNSFPLESVKLLVPCIPPTFYAVGLNYMDHIRWAAGRLGQTPKPPDRPDVGYRANNALIAHGEPVVIPKGASSEVQYEGELVVIIGKKAKHLSKEEALGCVLGYTIGNDVSERTWQRSDRTLWRAKNADTFKPMGPWIETDVDLSSMRTQVRLNGAVMSDFETNRMVFGIADYIAEITRYITLYPGDVIWMGTDGHTENMKPGDTVEVEISGIGVLKNPVVAEKERG